jgi:hypothetical protein
VHVILLPPRVATYARLLIARRTITRLFVTLLLCGAVGLTTGTAGARVASATACGPDGGNFGTELLGSAWPGGFTGVPVYSNGPSSSYDNGCENTAKTPKGVTVQTGTEWQCVELVNRLYVTKGWTDTTWHGDGDTMWSQAPNGLQGAPQGSITYLAPGDVVSVEVQPPPMNRVLPPEEPGGHVLIVSRVSGSNITFVSQNARKNTTATVMTSGILVGGALTMAASSGWTYPVTGVVHAPAWLSGSLIFPPGATAVQFDSIACPSKGTCVVVGSYNDAKSYRQGIIETLSNGNWRETEAPLPVKTSGNPEALLVAVSCPSATYCVAVGGFGGPPKTTYAGLVETLSGSPLTWKPKPSETGVPLAAVACGAVGRCVAVSNINVMGGRNIIETLSNGEWKATQATAPSGVQPADVLLDAVTCLNSHFCAAAGDVSLPNENESHGLVETLTGGSWVPSMATQETEVPLTSVACASTSLCAADGISADSSSANSLGGWGNVLATFSKGHLSDEMAPLPRGSTYKPHPLDPPTVACPPGGPCTAALEYYDSRGARQVLVETLSAGGWAPTQAPIPLPADEAGSSWPSIVAGSAACAASTYCALVGIYELGIDGTAINAGFIDVWSEGHWATIEVQKDPALGELTMVSCPTVGWCVAVGPTGFVEQAPGD